MIDFEVLSKKLKGIKAIVLGDMMLDSYLWGAVQRISPEAPVPVIEINREEYRLGGAANVALNIAALGAKAVPVGLVGDDKNAGIVRKLFRDKGIQTGGLVVDMARKTTTKTRIGAANQQIVRIDIEEVHEMGTAVQGRILEILQQELAEAKLLIIADYNKGLMSNELIAEVLKLCESKKAIVAVDPKQKNFFNYKKVDIFKPNYSELQVNLGLRFENDEDFFAGAKEVLERLDCRYLVVTRGERGMYIFEKGQEVRHLPSYAREVYDVSGAGDTVISALGLAFSVEEEIEDAASFANHAAGVVCGKLGTATATIEEIIQNARYH